MKKIQEKQIKELINDWEPYVSGTCDGFETGSYSLDENNLSIDFHNRSDDKLTVWYKWNQDALKFIYINHDYDEGWWD